MGKSEHLTKADYVARREAREAARESARRKRRAAVAAVALAGILAVGGTIAWLTDETPEVTNVFTPASVPITVVESFNGETKSDVQIQNTGDIDAYVRAYAVVNWTDADGNIVPEVPEGYSYAPSNIFEGADGWVQGSDGYWYHLAPVAPGGLTGVLIDEIIQSKEGDDYALQVDIVAQSIQADGVNADEDPAVVEAWGPTVTAVDGDGKLVVTA